MVEEVKYKCNECKRNNITEYEHSLLEKFRKENIGCDCSIAKFILYMKEENYEATRNLSDLVIKKI